MATVAPTAAGAVTAKIGKRGGRPGGLIAASEARAGLLFVVPYLVFFLFLQLGALACAFWVSLHHYDLIALDNPFVGVENYLKLPGNHDFLIALRNTTEYAVVVVVLQTIAALIFAILLDAKIKGRNFFRATWYTPSIASSAVISMIFLRVYHPPGLHHDRGRSPEGDALGGLPDLPEPVQRHRNGGDRVRPGGGAGHPDLRPHDHLPPRHRREDRVLIWRSSSPNPASTAPRQWRL